MIISDGPDHNSSNNAKDFKNSITRGSKSSFSTRRLPAESIPIGGGGGDDIEWYINEWIKNYT